MFSILLECVLGVGFYEGDFIIYRFNVQEILKFE
jgi:hypothetical protein